MLFVLFAVSNAVSGNPAGPNDVPTYVPQSFDCAIRKFALKHAQDNSLGPVDIAWKDVADALQLESKCAQFEDSNNTLLVSADTASWESYNLFEGHSDDNTFYVDPTKGSDSNAGTITSPFQTITRGIKAARMLKGANKTIILRDGVYYIAKESLEGLTLTSADSNLMIKGFPGENAIVSGGVPLSSTKWSKFGERNGHTIWMSDVALDSIPGLRLDRERVVRARHPNGNPETMGLHTIPTGWVSAAESWLPGRAANGPATPPIEIFVGSINRSSSYSVYPFYTNAIGGICNGLFTPNVSFWCNPRNPRDGAHGVWNGSGGLVYNDSASLDDKPWTNETNGIVQVWHNGGHWATQMYMVDKRDIASKTITWSKGGFQDARASPEGAEWYVENIFELLDSPNEFYFSQEQKRLYLCFNGTGPPSGDFIATQLHTLLRVTGNQEEPVEHVSLVNITFRDAAQTFMEPHGVPSSGDWALQRMAGVFLEGTQGTVIAGCKFIRMDGNGVMLSGYNRNATIIGNTFQFIGDSAMAAWGTMDDTSDNGTHGYDGTKGDFPRYTLVAHNIVSELGLWEKQSSAWFQARSMQTSLVNNIFFNGPRAGINFNDGFGGGNLLQGNLLFNFCRESTDHGPFNSWDRQLYLVNQPDDNGNPSVYPQFNVITQNIMIANYQSQEAVDNDDGSGYYKTHHNVLVYGNYGQKADMGGHDNFHENNLYAYLFPVCYVDLGGGEAIPAHRNGFHNNTCIQGMDIANYAGVNCKDNASIPSFSNNKIYNPSGVTGFCGMTEAQWQAQGHDPGTTVHKGIPKDADIITMAANILSSD
eukprot:m.19976 g.19976  ORF g.19976 m.19976 type:complete len:818 (+) comp6723_c0_seq1:67-2520(+)